jgi:hypothetical protein
MCRVLNFGKRVGVEMFEKLLKFVLLLEECAAILILAFEISKTHQIQF